MLITRRTNKKLNHKEEKTISLPKEGGKLAPTTQERKIKTSKTKATLVVQKGLNILFNIVLIYKKNEIKVKTK